MQQPSQFEQVLFEHEAAGAGFTGRVTQLGDVVVGDHDDSCGRIRLDDQASRREAVHAGELEPEVARERIARVNALPIRLLGDAVLRRRAWEVADQLGWAETYDAEYVALTLLQADAFVTLDTELARTVEGIVDVATIDALRKS